MSEFGQPLIDSSDLRQSHVPDPGGDFLAIEEFALTFDGYERWGSFEECAAQATAVQEAWGADKPPKDLDLLRNALFFAQRAYRHTMQPMTINGVDYPDDETVEDAQHWPRALVRAIHELLPE